MSDAETTQTETTTKPSDPTGVQAYYTKDALAYCIWRYYYHRFQTYTSEKALDLCAGTGNLSFRITTKRKDYRMPTHYVEPEEHPASYLETLASTNHGQVFHMTAEEYMVTYGERGSFDHIFCNPPFGERLGRTNLGELVRDIHLPNVTRFETYFLTIASILGKGRLLFTVPDAYFKTLEARSVLESMRNSGWDLFDVRALPIDGYENAVVSTCMWIWQKVHSGTTTIPDWVDHALNLVNTGTAKPLIEYCEETTIYRPNRSPVSGYLLPRKKDDEESTKTEKAGRTEQNPPKPDPIIDVYRRFPALEKTGINPYAGFSFTQPPRQLGDLWERMGCMFELTENGWTPANCPGYSMGKPVTEGFSQAELAFQILSQGGFHTCRALIGPLDLEGLQIAHQELATASFLRILEKGPYVANYLEMDLQTVGILDFGSYDIKLDIPNTVKRFQSLLYLPEALTDGQLAKLYLSGAFADDPEMVARVHEKLEGHQIPLHKIDLRVPWIPKSLIAEYAELQIDEEGYFDLKAGYRAYHTKKPLAAYLNYSKGPYRIQKGDEVVFEVASQKFAGSMNHWLKDKHQNLRLKVHAHYIASHAQNHLVAQKLKILKSAKSLRWWQKDDIPFALSGQALINWDVGLGKTGGGITAAMAHPGQTLIVVPNSVISNWAKEITDFYPGTRYEVLGFKKTKTGDYKSSTGLITEQAKKYFFDPKVKIILTTYEVMARMQVSTQLQTSADEEDAWAMVGHSMKQTAVKQRERAIQYAAQRNYLFGGEFNFSDLPLNNLLIIVDEAHNFKSLNPMPSSGWHEHLVMAGNCSESKRSRDMKIKLDLLRKAGGKSLGLTATPVSNSVVEAFNMLRIFAPDVLSRRSILNPQQFINQFCLMSPISAMSITGKMVKGQTITGFCNLDDLSAMWSECMITRTAKDVGLKLPEAEERVIRIKPTGVMYEVMQDLKSQLGDIIKGENGEEREVHIFEIISKLDAISSYPKSLGIDDNPKGERLVAEVAKRYHETDGGQLIFSDRLESHDGLKAMLIEKGIEAKHICILNAKTAKTIGARLKVQKAYNAGQYRVVIGGAVASEGINLQTNTIAIHFNNLAWEGKTIHQRKGRGIRQGNNAKKVEVLYYILESGTDVYRYATINTKSSWWNQMRQAQTDTVTENIFTAPVNDDLLISLSVDAEETREFLASKRTVSEVQDQTKTFDKLVNRIMLFLNPEAMDANLPIRQELEKKLRALHHIPSAVIDEAVVRLQKLAWLLSYEHKRSVKSGYDHKWDQYGQHCKNYLVYPVSYFYQIFLLNEDKESGLMRFEYTLDECFGKSMREKMPEFEVTFGEPEVVHQTARQITDNTVRVVMIGDDEPEMPEPEPAEPEVDVANGEAKAESVTKKDSAPKPAVQQKSPKPSGSKVPKPSEPDAPKEHQPSLPMEGLESENPATRKPKPATTQVAMQLTLFEDDFRKAKAAPDTDAKTRQMLEQSKEKYRDHRKKLRKARKPQVQFALLDTSMCQKQNPKKEEENTESTAVVA